MLDNMLKATFCISGSVCDSLTFCSVTSHAKHSGLKQFTNIYHGSVG